MSQSSASTLAYNNTTATNQQLLLNTGSMVLNADLTVQNISATTTLANVINISRDLTGSGQLIVDTYNNINSGSSDFAAGRVSLGGANGSWSGNPNFTRLSGNNTYSGATSIGANAVLNINSSAGNAIGDSSAVNFAGAGSVLIFNTTHESVGSIASEGTNGAINLGANTLTAGGNDIALMVVPEPQSAMLASLSLLVLLRRRRP